MEEVDMGGSKPADKPAAKPAAKPAVVMTKAEGKRPAAVRAPGAAVTAKQEPRGASMESDDDEVEELDMDSIQLQQPAATSLDSDDDEDVACVETGNGMVNPMIALPHMRWQCQKHLFGNVHASDPKSLEARKLSCNNCYCYVCDCSVRECKNWATHYEANPTGPKGRQWRLERTAKKTGQAPPPAGGYGGGAYGGYGLVPPPTYNAVPAPAGSAAPRSQYMTCPACRHMNYVGAQVAPKCVRCKSAITVGPPPPPRACRLCALLHKRYQVPGTGTAAADPPIILGTVEISMSVRPTDVALSREHQNQYTAQGHVDDCKTLGADPTIRKLLLHVKNKWLVIDTDE